MLIDRGLPLVGYRFAVVIMTTGIPNPVDIEFKEVSGLKMSRSIVKNAGMTSLDNQLPTQNLLLKRGVFSSISPLTLANTVESFFWDTRLLRKDILICVLDENNLPQNSWLVSNAYLESWEWDGLNASSNELLIESMSFKYSGIKYVPI
ncbi:phage tail protein [Shewanella surugensis]|uniref:Phage tail protein n=1 Tax=Shewanella surugensis TaxID=212020 RepID=A0ABT0L6A9_9GAMM|nr:phage tail protein [Shewanella surugensis]MCL1123200.1 phage tail protein [Shewanella surugensis]